jgi:hypothetical protein
MKPCAWALFETLAEILPGDEAVADHPANRVRDGVMAPLRIAAERVPVLTRCDGRLPGLLARRTAPLVGARA